MLFTVHSSEHLLAASQWPSRHQVHCGRGGRSRETEDKSRSHGAFKCHLKYYNYETTAHSAAVAIRGWHNTHTHTHNMHINVLYHHTNPETHAVSVSIIFTEVHLKLLRFNAYVCSFYKSPDVLWPQAPLQRLLSVFSVMCF